MHPTPNLPRRRPSSTTFDRLFARSRGGRRTRPHRDGRRDRRRRDGAPSARTVLLKAHDARGFVFYTHLDGRKGRELQANPHAALLFHWPRVRHGVQVRIEGAVEIVDDAEADAYFASRPRGSQLGAWASLQSETLESRETFEAAPGRGRAALRRPRRAAPAALDRLPRACRDADRVLVRRRIPPARAPAARTRRRRHVVDSACCIRDARPPRIVCLTEEPTETLYALGEQDRIVGISGFTVRPPIARAREAEGQRVHQREDRRDPRAAAGFRDRLLRHPGRHRRRADPPRRRGVDHATTAASTASSTTSGAWARWSARGERAEAYADELRRGLDAIAARRRATAAPPARVFRRMGRAADHRHPLGRRTRAHRRRRRHLPRARAGIAGEAAHPRRSATK